MVEEHLAQCIGVSVDSVNRLLLMPQHEIYTDPEYQQWIQSLDVGYLDSTLLKARTAYEKYLPHFRQTLKDEYHIDNTRMSSYTLGSWLVGFLQYPQTLSKLPTIHRRLPPEAVAQMLPEMLVSLKDMGDDYEVWQRALAILALPLLTSA